MKKRKNSLNEAINALKNESVSTSPLQEVIDTTLQKLTQASYESHSTIIKERIKTVKSFTKVAAAAAGIILAIGIFIGRRGPTDTRETRSTSKATQSPAEMLTVSSLNCAYRRGGMDAVEKQYDQVLEILGTEPAKISRAELLAGLNGT